MSKKHKKDKKKDKYNRLETIVLATAILNLLKEIIELINKLLE